MAASLNRVTLIGRLGKDPDCKATANGNAVTLLSIATEESWKKDGQKQTRTEWHRVVLYGKPAELAAQYLAKGHRVMIEGQLQTR
ncbi:single-stranded DNA-binding protein, partial [Endozoicomonas acroporae]